MSRRDLLLPELGIDDQPIVLSLWLAKEGSRIAEGDQLAEVLCGGATVDLPAPAAGLLRTKLVEEGDPLVVGQRLAVIESP
jgi:pyruvate/2-oxoglutarate dehydrogenase complex dihydrolipoamide acyltransferase (E2) component